MCWLNNDTCYRFKTDEIVLILRNISNFPASDATYEIIEYNHPPVNLLFCQVTVLSW